jgi:hypothetical protein
VQRTIPILWAQKSSSAQRLPTALPKIRRPWEYIEEINQILKTASPLLVLSMETVEQIHQIFKKRYIDSPTSY